MESENAGGFRFETDRSVSHDDFDEDMAAFEAECARRLAQEHERRAKEEKAAEIAKAAEELRAETMPEIPPEPEQNPEPEDKAEPEQNPEPDDKPEPERNPETQEEPETGATPESQPEMSPDEELAAIMRAESAALPVQSATTGTVKDTNDEEEEEEYAEKDEVFSDWLRVVFTLMLLFLGAAGVYVMLGMDYHSYIFDPLCFVEISVCLLTAVGLNVSLIQFRISKEIIMRLAAYSLFAFYIIYAADALFLRKLLAHGIDKTHVIAYAKSHINADLIGGLSTMGTNAMLSCAVMMVPFAFFLLMLMKPFRNLLLYILTVVFCFFAVGMLRILSMAGSFNLSQGVMAFVGALGAYLIFFFPPLKKVMTDVGLIIGDYDDDDDDY